MKSRKIKQDKAGAPLGNRNAEKWTLEEAIILFDKAINLTKETDTQRITDKQGNITNLIEFYKYDFIGEIARELKTFHKIFMHLVSRFPELKEQKSLLDTNIETNCYSNTKKGVIREATGIVNLKSNWGWRDRQDVDLTSAGKELKPVNITVNTPDLATKIESGNFFDEKTETEQ